MKGERSLIEKTGFGKSLCFQFPAVIFEGITVVFSADCLDAGSGKKLNSLGISANVSTVSSHRRRTHKLLQRQNQD